MSPADGLCLIQKSKTCQRPAHVVWPQIFYLAKHCWIPSLTTNCYINSSYPHMARLQPEITQATCLININETLDNGYLLAAAGSQYLVICFSVSFQARLLAFQQKIKLQSCTICRAVFYQLSFLTTWPNTRSLPATLWLRILISFSLLLLTFVLLSFSITLLLLFLGVYRCSVDYPN